MGSAGGRSPFAGSLRACPEPAEGVPLRYVLPTPSMLRAGSVGKSKGLFPSLLDGLLPCGLI